MIEPKSKVLCVGYDASFLSELRAGLRGRFELRLVSSAKAGLEALADGQAFSVVIADLQMPEVDGLDFLVEVSERDPGPTRILFIDDADVDRAMASLRCGEIDRFVCKPCPDTHLVTVVSAAVHQSRLSHRLRDSLEQIVFAGLDMFAEVLASSDSQVFRDAVRIAHRAGHVATRLGEMERWKMEMAAMLWHADQIALPPETIEQLWFCHAPPESVDDSVSFDRVPESVVALLAEIPRVDEVEVILREVGALRDPTRRVTGKVSRPAQILNATLDFDARVAGGAAAEDAFRDMGRSLGDHDFAVLSTVERVSISGKQEERSRALSFTGPRARAALFETDATD